MGIRTTGRWQLSLDVSEQNQIDQEDLLLDAQSSFEEFLEQEDLDSISEDDLLEGEMRMKFKLLYRVLKMDWKVRFLTHCVKMARLHFFLTLVDMHMRISIKILYFYV